MAIDPREIQLTHEQQVQLADMVEQSGKDWPCLLAELLNSHQCEPRVDDARDANGAQSLYDALRRDGYLGAVVGGPTDMSTNPEYLEGFGQAR